MRTRKVPAAKLRRIRMLLLDVDGVLTDGSVTYSTTGEEWKQFNIKDGHGIVTAREHGITVGIITGRSSGVVTRRAKELGIEEVHQDSADKSAVYARILAKHGLSDDEVAYIGDDEPDLPVLARVGLSAAPSDAVASVRKAVDHVCSLPGGRGAVREVIDMLLSVRSGR